MALSLYFAAFVAPYLALPLTPVVWPEALAAAAVGVGANLLLRLALAVRFRHSPVSVLLHPVAVLALCAIALNSWRWHRRGQVWWRGRAYPARGSRA